MNGKWNLPFFMPHRLKLSATECYALFLNFENNRVYSFAISLHKGNLNGVKRNRWLVCRHILG